MTLPVQGEVVEIGQVWASTDRRDVDGRWNQHRKVVDVDDEHVWLSNGARTTRLTLSDAGIPRHRRVSGPRWLDG